MQGIIVVCKINKKNVLLNICRDFGTKCYEKNRRCFMVKINILNKKFGY